jgi:hypothetical protein
MTIVEALASTAAEDCASWRTKDLDEYVGKLSKTSKMPGFSYGLPAQDCIAGGKLRSVAGSTCSDCYAFERGAYAWRPVKAAYRRRADAIGRPLWVSAMAELIARKCRRVPFFRWHDSGDLQSVEHLANICEIARRTPDVRHWLPTREYRIVTDYVTSGGTIPDNLNVRMSAHMVGGHVPTFPRLRGLVTVSTVSRNVDYPDARDCPSRFQGNSCRDCRACWSRDVAHVDYHLH